MKQNSKNLLIGGLVLIVLILIGALHYAKKQNSRDGEKARDNTEQTTNGNSSDNAAIVPASEEGQAVVSNEPGRAVIQGKPLTYDQIAEIYIKSGYRFQISNCHATPGKLNMKTGTKFMIDNRDKVKHTFKFDSQTYNVPAYGWAIATAPKYGNYFLTCDGSGAAEVQVYP